MNSLKLKEIVHAGSHDSGFSYRRIVDGRRPERCPPTPALPATKDNRPTGSGSTITRMSITRTTSSGRSSSTSMYYRYPPQRQIPVYNTAWHNFYPEPHPWHQGRPSSSTSSERHCLLCGTGF